MSFCFAAAHFWLHHDGPVVGQYVASTTAVVSLGDGVVRRMGRNFSRAKRGECQNAVLIYGW